ncbi:tyrosine-type recombinase/integrase [Enterococcus gallinarum]|uniref:Site-specific integrase n=1 Tax=Enterococcus gallinarum TaxID=1353 RepID=A0AAE7SZI1_ENTGA|nr:site-specific integrase [Enterococcus gallinarum]MBM6742052.1 site-specific integrase [Enterococcus gallinarum]QOG26959.1 site-specific integrase [Enterococcus gallinarum]ROY68958.1 site-specific integrase [Enterococcus gallinarum]ROZ02735.1 site-specific integrase [Enterococcus gallinarum]ROZ09240.1 site-specific integrase [Enterococcus gallinarum]
MWVEDLGNGRYKFIERYKDPYSEKYKKKSVILTSNSAQASNKARKILDKRINEAVNEKKKERIMFHDAIDQWYESHKKPLRNSSKMAYSATIKTVKEMINSDVWMDNIDAPLLQAAFNKLDYSDEYMSTIKSIFNMVFEYARRMSYIDFNPMTDIIIKKRPKTREDFKKLENKYLEREEAEKLIEELYRRPSTYRLGRLAEFMFLTGMRVGEATAMQPNDFDIKNQQAFVNGSIDRTEGYRKGVKGPVKTNASYRTIDITQRTIDLVQRTIDEVSLDAIDNPKFKKLNYLFVTKNGVPVQINSFNLGLKKAGARIGLEHKNLSSHIFRHTHISWLAEKGYPLKAIMDRVGHEDSKITNQIYTHVTKNMRANILEDLEKDGL